MSFNPDARIDASRVRRRRGGAAVGGVTLAGGLGLVALLLLSNWIGVDLTGLAGALDGGSRTVSQSEAALEECASGADANASVDCRIAGAADSLDEYWGEFFAAQRVQYRSPTGIILFSGATGTACGPGQSGMGPFYCPSDETIYLDTAFFDELGALVGVELGPLAQLYVVGHEWAHHVQQVGGIMHGLDLADTGVDSDTVRLELQADCFAGAWLAGASQTTDQRGEPLLLEPTPAELANALLAAKVIGDDFLQAELGGAVAPEAWTHGSSESRVRWLERGYASGPEACTTFQTPVGEL